MAQATLADSPMPAEPRVDARQWLVLALVLCGTFMAVFDVFVVNVAVPTIQRDLQASFAQVQFVIAGYTLTYAVALVTGGRLGDIYGRKRLFMVGLAGFILTSTLCGLAPAPWFLVAARLAQGLAAALLTPQVLSIIQVTFLPIARRRALALYGAVVSFGGLAGQVLGGFLIRANLFALSWRPVFLVNVPIGLVALIAAAVLLTEAHSASALRLDWGGVGLVSLGLALLAYPLVAGREAGWPIWAWLCLGASVPALAVFARYERWQTARSGSPLVVLRLFRQRAFVAGLLVAFALNVATGSYLFVLALYLQLGLRYSPLAAGLTLAPAGVGFFFASLLSVRFSRRFGNRAIAYAVVFSIMTWTAMAAAVQVNQERLPHLLIGVIVGLSGFAVGSTSPPLFAVVLADVDREDAGSASGVLVTCQQIGSALGVALIGIIFFGVLAGWSAGVNDALARNLGVRLTPTSLTTEQVTTVVADFQVCANDRARSHDPVITPASCQRPTLVASDPAVRAIVGAGLQRANARDYAQAYVASMLVSAGFLVVAAYGAFFLPAPRRKARRLRAPSVAPA